MSKDLRGFIEELKKREMLKTVSTEVDWKYELGGWARKAGELGDQAPALLFDHIKDYPEGSRVFTSGLATYKHIALALGLDPATSIKDLINVYKERSKDSLPHRLVKDGPVKENIHLNNIDLYEFPIPWWTPKDGGRYLGTWHANITRHPETGKRNVGMYRVQIIDKDQCAVGFMPFSHMGQHFASARNLDKPLEMAMVIGADETLCMAAATGCPAAVDEIELAGSLSQEPVEMVKCETINLEVPANAEIVIEGIVLPDKTASEGPFGEHTGYYGGGVRQRPVFQVTAVTHRNDPILRGTLLGKPTTEFHTMMSMISSAAATALFEAVGPEDVLAVHCPPAADSILMAIIQLKQRYVGHGRNAAHILKASSACRYLKWIILVDEDIDPFDLGQVWWAMTTRTQGSRDIEVLPFGTTSRSDPSVTKGEYTDKVIVDATKKLDYPISPLWNSHWAPTCLPPEEIMELVNLKWHENEEAGQKQAIEGLTHKIRETLEPLWEKERERYRLEK